MYNTKGCLVLLLVIAVLSSANLLRVEGSIRLPASKVSSFQRSLNQILKRADSNTNYASRTKRYTDYQEQSSAVCTGLCMYMEEKSYMDCFDLCNY